MICPTARIITAASPLSADFTAVAGEIGAAEFAVVPRRAEAARGAFANRPKAVSSPHACAAMQKGQIARTTNNCRLINQIAAAARAAAATIKTHQMRLRAEIAAEFGRIHEHPKTSE